MHIFMHRCYVYMYACMHLCMYDFFAFVSANQEQNAVVTFCWQCLRAPRAQEYGCYRCSLQKRASDARLRLVRETNIALHAQREPPSRRGCRALQRDPKPLSSSCSGARCRRHKGTCVRAHRQTHDRDNRHATRHRR